MNWFVFLLGYMSGTVVTIYIIGLLFAARKSELYIVQKTNPTGHTGAEFTPALTDRTAAEAAYE